MLPIHTECPPAPPAAAEPAAPYAAPAPPRPAAGPRLGLGWAKTALKWAGLSVGLAAAAAPAALCWLEARLSSQSEVFCCCGQALSLVPGLPGKYLRKCFYRLTLQACSLNWEIGFLSYFSQRQAEVGERVYVGQRTTIGTATLGDGAAIGSRVSILSGGQQHQHGPDGKLSPCLPESLRGVRVGEETWIGEAVVVMGDVGSRCIVAAGSVVSGAVPDGCVVGGNPARFVRRTMDAPAAGASDGRGPNR
jgi:acetyltransferase-like isoleucine patch superfamily enzyme